MRALRLQSSLCLLVLLILRVQGQAEAPQAVSEESIQEFAQSAPALQAVRLPLPFVGGAPSVSGTGKVGGVPGISDGRGAARTTAVGGAPGVSGAPGGGVAQSVAGVPGIEIDFTISHPYTVSLRTRADSRYFCAGVLIGRRHVLTAAHCVDSSRSNGDNRPQVVVGSASSTMTSGPGVQVLSTQNVFIHPNYRTRRYPDLAIVELSNDANQDPVKLPSTNYRPGNGVSLLAIGWGRQSSSSGNSELVQVVSMGYITRGDCIAKLGRFVRVREICMGGEGAGSCEGDNGAPIVVPGATRNDDILVGIVGSVHVCGRFGTPDVHTNVVPFINWIKQTAGI